MVCNLLYTDTIQSGIGLFLFSFEVWKDDSCLEINEGDREEILCLVSSLLSLNPGLVLFLFL